MSMIIYWKSLFAYNLEYIHQMIIHFYIISYSIIYNFISLFKIMFTNISNDVSITIKFESII